MSWQRAADEPYVTRFETEVTAVDENRVWLDTSYFFAASGGQPTDRGAIKDIPVVDVEVQDGEPVHHLESTPTLRAGHRVMCRIDWDFRMYCMRAHTAAHALVGATRQLLDAPVTGTADIDAEAVTVFLQTDEPLTQSDLIELDRLLNEVVWDSLPVTWTDIEIAEARDRPGITFTDETEPEAVQSGRVRVVTIGDGDEADIGIAADRQWDVTACGGTHVRNTREIGPVTVLGHERVDASHSAVTIAVGPEAIDRRAGERLLVTSMARAFDTDVATLLDHPEEVQTQLDRY